MKTSFAELYQAETVSPRDLLDTMQDYAETGAAISANVVVNVLSKCDLSRRELEVLIASAAAGAAKHEQMSDCTPFQHLPPEISKRMRDSGNFLGVLEYGEQAQFAKKNAELGEAAEYRKVMNVARSYWVEAM